MATRILRDPTLLRELDATAEAFRDLCDDKAAREAADALQAILARQAERSGQAAEERAA